MPESVNQQYAHLMLILISKDSYENLEAAIGELRKSIGNLEFKDRIRIVCELVGYIENLRKFAAGNNNRFLRPTIVNAQKCPQLAKIIGKIESDISLSPNPQTPLET